MRGRVRLKPEIITSQGKFAGKNVPLDTKAHGGKDAKEDAVDELAG
jgi:hypothetical protein